MKLRLWQLQTLVVAVTVFFGTLGYGAYSSMSQVERERGHLVNDLRNLALGIAAGSIEDLANGDYERIESRLLQQARLSSIESLLVADREGRVVAEVRRPRGAEPRAIYQTRQVNVVTQFREQTTDDGYRVSIPIERGLQLGQVALGANFEALDVLRRLLWRDAALLALVTAGLLILIQGFFFRRVGATLEAIATFADDLVHQRGARLDPQSGVEELRHLKTALNNVSLSLAEQYRTLADSEARKAALLQSSLDALVTVDDHGAIVEVNPAAELMFGHSRSDMIDADMAEMIIPPQYREAHSNGMLHYRKTGEGPILGKRLELPALRSNGEEFPCELTVVPVMIGRKRLFLGAIRDLTQRRALEEARERSQRELQAALNELDARNRALDRHALISITDLQGRIAYANDTFLEATGHHRDDILGQDHRLLKSAMRDNNTYPSLWPTLARGDAWHAEIFERRRDGSPLWLATTIAPIVDDQGRPNRYIQVSTDITEQKRYAMELADARRRELAVGFEIQKTLLMGQLPEQISNARIAAHYQPHDGIDGDFYHFIRHRNGDFDIVIADVMGKGIPAALIGAGVKQELVKWTSREQSQQDDIGGTVTTLNAALYQRLFELGIFVTLAYLRFSPSRGHIDYVDAGHTKALLAGAGGVQQLEGDNLPLGVLQGEQYQRHRTDWHIGDLLLLYSDGLTEASNPAGELFGSERLAQMLESFRRENVPNGTVAAAIREANRTYRDGNPLNDDYTCIAVELQDPAACEQRWTIPWRLEELPTLRERLRDALKGCELPADRKDALLLAATETASNVMRHVTPPGEEPTLKMSVRMEAGAVELAFFYIGDPFQPSAAQLQPDLSGEHSGGLGLFIVHQSVDQVDYDALSSRVNRIRMSVGHHTRTNTVET